MHRWLYFAVSCTAAIGIACGGDSGDGKVYDARLDAAPSFDAKTFDAPSPDARTFDATPTFDARPDAPPTIDAQPPVIADAGPDAPPPIVFDAGPDAPPPCVSDPGCTGAGSFCSDADTSITCAAVAGSPTCFKITATTPCTGALVCSGSVTPGQCGCPAPTGGPATEGGACAQLNQQTCSADGRAVLTCGTVDSCQVYTIAVPAADTCDNAEGTGDGLTCVNNQCVCPPNPTSIFYANPVVDRTARPGLVRNGNRFPALCSFDTMTLALNAAKAPQFAETGIAVAAKDSPPVADIGKPAVFDNETFPWAIPTGRIMTTTDDPVSGVGGTGVWVPQNFVVVVNGGGDGPASVTVEGAIPPNRTTRGGSLRGLTFVEGSCAGDTCDISDTAILIHDHGTPASSFNALNNVLVEGGGGAIVNETTTGIRTGAVTATVSGDNVTLDIAGDANANAFTGLAAGDDFWIGISGSPDAALNGFFLVNSFTDGNTVVVKNPDATAGGTFTAQLTVVSDHVWQTGIRVTNSNARFVAPTVRDFASFGGNSGRVGLALESDFGGDPAAGVEADVIRVQGGRFYMNNTGIRVNGNDDDLNVAINQSHIDNSFNAGLRADDGVVTATGVIQSGTFSEGDPAVGFLITNTADVTLSGVTATGNAQHGVLYLADGVGSLTDSGSTFTANDVDGVNVGGGPVAAAKPQAVTTADVELGGSTLSANGRYGLNVEADEHTVWVRGGSITGNDQDGIHQSGNSLLVTNALAAARAEITANGDSGLEATAGEVRMNDTNVTGNATNDNCDSEVAAEDLAVNAVIIGGSASIHAVNVDVRSNRGGGYDIGTGGDARPNTISGGLVSFNISTNTCGDGETDPSSGPGILVREGAHLQFVNSPVTISGNASVGLYVEGVVDEFTPARTEPVAEASTAINVNDNEWTGVIVAAGGLVQQTGGGVNTNGTNPAGTAFNDGVEVHGTYRATNTGIATNKGDGVIVDLATAADRATLTNTSIHNNLGNGVVILSAPGAVAGEIDLLDPVIDEEYGFLIRTAPGSDVKVPVFSNGGDGFTVGSASQTQSIVAKIGDVSINNNGGVGINVRQKDTLVAGSACTDGVGNGCTGVSILSNDIFDNTTGGIVLRTAFIKRLLGGAEQRGFSGNSLFHNALNMCGGTQTASQIVVNGPTGLADGACAGKSASTCPEQNDPATSENDLNNQCVFLGGQCVVAWDLSSGPTSATCSLANSFRDYIRDGAPNANQEGGIFATQGARVLAGFNNWPQTNPVEGIDFTFSADGNSVVLGGSGCNSSGFTCTEPPPPPQ